MLIQKDLLNKLIDLANISIEYLNAKDDDIEWITVKGNHIPIKKGQTEEEAFEAFLSKVEDKSSKKVADKTQTKEFKEWFGDSKVVDEDGKPLVVYHGTNEEFNVFDKNKRGSNTDKGIFGKGFYFSKNLKTSQAYGKNIKETYLSIQNPFMSSDYKSKEEMAEYLGVEVSILREGGTGISSLQSYTGVFSEAIKQKGHDGVITKFGEIVVFEPNQIKSVENKGTFRKDSNNINE